MLVNVVKLNFKKGKGKEFEKVFKVMQKGVLDNEKDMTFLYEAYKVRDQEDVYWVIEKYRDDAALEEHMTRAYFLDNIPKVMELLESETSLEVNVTDTFL